VLHVQAGNGSLRSYFDTPSVQASSTFWVGKAGQLEQYVDSSLRAWAQAAGNSTYCSVETEGQPGEALTDAQVNTLAKLYRWGHEVHGWPYVIADIPGAKGFAWHGMGGRAWGGHTGCPGDLRKAQRPRILQLAQGGIPAVVVPEEDDIMADPQAVEALLTSAVLDAYRTVYGDGFVPSDDAVKVQVDAAKTQGMVAVYGLMYRAKQRAK
jgi:hypothetical protein